MSVMGSRGRHARIHAKNFTGSRVQKRLDNTVAAIQTQLTNAQMVDAHHVLYFSRHKGATACTCRQTPVEEGDRPQDLIVPVDSFAHGTFTVDHRAPLFGEHGTDVAFDEQIPDEDVDFDDNAANPTLFNGGNACALCYKTGTVPGYSIIGHERFVLCTHDIRDLDGYFINRSAAPNVFERQHHEGFVEFAVDVPLFFKTVSISVRDGADIVTSDVLTGGHVVSTQDFIHNAGNIILLRVTAESFTHLVVCFDIGVDTRISLAQLSRTTDWTLFDTVGSLEVSLPIWIPEVQTGDVIVIPERDLSLKVTDVPSLRTARGQPLDWRATVRVLQPQEPLKWIAKGFNLL